MRALPVLFLGSALLCGSTAAAEDKPVRELEPVHVNAMRNPEVRKYKVILAGLDAFDRHHALAPGVPELRFRLQQRRGAGVPQEPRVRIEGGGDFVLPLALDATNRFTVPRSKAALDAAGELVLNQKRRFYQIVPEVRTPGLPGNVRRLGDLRLECKVMIAIAKEEMPLLWVVTLNGVLLTRDWCSFFSERERGATFGFKAGAPLAAAILTEGKRSKALKTSSEEFEVALSDVEWSDEALVELRFAEPAATGTAGETPRTGP